MHACNPAPSDLCKFEASCFQVSQGYIVRPCPQNNKSSIIQQFKIAGFKRGSSKPHLTIQLEGVHENPFKNSRGRNHNVALCPVSSQRENSHSAIRNSLAGKGKHWLKEDLAPNQFHVRAGGSLHPGQKMAETDFQPKSFSWNDQGMAEISTVKHTKGNTQRLQAACLASPCPSPAACTEAGGENEQ